VKIEGSVNGESKKFAYDVKFPDDSSENDFIPRLWATRRVGYLLDEIRLRGENKELKDEVSELARKYNIVTPYTAYLIMEDETRRAVPTAMRSLHFENNIYGLNELRSDYYAFQTQKDGSGAVGGARSTSRLKAAQSASEAIQLGREEAFRGGLFDAGISGPALQAPNAPLPSDQSSLGSIAAAKPAVSYSTPVRVTVAKRSEELASNSRFLKGRTFYLNGSQWIDSLVQTVADAKRIRVQFNSPEYFDLLKQHPEASAWLSVGRNLQLLLGNAVYEIYDRGGED